MKQFLRKRKAVASILILLAVVLVPYVWSRVASSGCQIQSFGSSVEYEGMAKTSLRVACYNIAHGRGLAESNWEGGDSATRIERLDDIAELLVRLDADVVVLNEVDFDASWSNRVNQAKYLAEKAGYSYRVEERNLDFRVLHCTWRFGNAILSRFPISNAEVIDLPSYAELETMVAGKKRGVRCDVSVGEKTLRVFGLHLSHRSEDVRELSAAKVVDLIDESPHACIVMGDMNSTPIGFPRSSQAEDGRNAMETFSKSGLVFSGLPELPLGNAELTFRSDDPKSIIDWILVSLPLQFESHAVEPSTLSDHRPVVAEVTW
jgi:endonuclease/exonuclease/phosphatase family metal-dependent hydrolase